MTTTDTGGLRALPKLNKRQIDRLVEIGLYPTTGRTDIKPATTAALVELGCVDLGHQIKDDLYEIELGTLGIRVLAGFPDHEFDRFREMLRESDRADV